MIVKSHIITLPSDWHGSCVLYECGNIGFVSFNAYCENVLADGARYPLFTVNQYGFTKGTQGVLKNNGANTTTIFAYLYNGSFCFTPHGGYAEANNYISGTFIAFK